MITGVIDFQNGTTDGKPNNRFVAIRERKRIDERDKGSVEAEVEFFILDHLYPLLPSPPFTDNDKQAAAREVYSYIWSTNAS